MGGGDAGKTVTVFVLTSLPHAVLDAVRVTMYVPAVAYVWQGGFCKVDVVPSPKSHKYVVVVLQPVPLNPLVLVLVKQTGVLIHAVADGKVKSAVGFFLIMIWFSVYVVVKQPFFAFKTAVKSVLGHDDVVYVCENKWIVLVGFSGWVNVTSGLPSPKLSSYVVPGELLNQLPIWNSTIAGTHSPVVGLVVVKLAKGFVPL